MGKEGAVGRNSDEVEVGVCKWSRARTPAEMKKLVFGVEIDVAGC